MSSYIFIQEAFLLSAKADKQLCFNGKKWSAESLTQKKTISLVSFELVPTKSRTLWGQLGHR